MPRLANERKQRERDCLNQEAEHERVPPADPVDQCARHQPGGQGGGAADRERETRVRERDPAHVVQVDDREWEDDAVAERVHDAACLDEPDGARKVRVEPAEVGRQRSHGVLRYPPCSSRPGSRRCGWPRPSSSHAARPTRPRSVDVELRHDGVSGFGEAAPIERYDESAESARAFVDGGGGAALRRWTRSRSRRSRRGCASGPASRRPRRRSTRRSTTSAGSSPACPSGGCSGCGGKGRRPRGRSGSAIPTTWRDAPSRCAARFKRLKLKLGGGTGSTSSASAPCASVTDVPLQVDVNEAWSLDEALEALPQLAELGVQYCEQPLPRRRPRRAGAEAPLAAPDLRRRGLPHAGRRCRLRRAGARA